MVFDQSAMVGSNVKVLVTGARGQLGQEVTELFRNKCFEVIGCSRQELDITDQNRVNQVMNDLKPEMIIHTAAYTNVDQAETDAETTYLVNTFGTRNVAMAAEAIGAKMCFISTDYVFDGTSHKPYQENDHPKPLNVYGKSKLRGEEMVKAFSSKHFIVRTSWVYGHHGNNFVKTMLRLAGERQELGVVHDQMGSPTYAVDLAVFLSELVQTDRFGIYHASNQGSCTWFEFANAIFEEAGIIMKVTPLETADYPRPAPRPKNSVMDPISIRANGFSELRHWREALKDFISIFKSRF